MNKEEYDSIKKSINKALKDVERHAIQTCIAYNLARYGEFDSHEFTTFVWSEKYRNLFHSNWNLISMKVNRYQRIN